MERPANGKAVAGRAAEWTVGDVMYTYADLEAIPSDGRRYEILDGELLVTASPNRSHQDAIGNLYLMLRRHVDKNDLGKVYVSPLDVVFSEIDVLEPDLLYLTKAQLAALPDDDNVKGVPELVVEVVSKGSKKRDWKTKRAAYERFKVKHYWILDPFTLELEENVLRDKRYVRRSKLVGKVSFKPACFPKLTIKLKDVWV